jgi:tellurite resistance protein TerC
VIKRVVHLTYKAARRIVVGVVGATVLLIGVVMLVTPGPALVVIPVGLAILSLEFAWARAWLRHLRESISNRNSNQRGARAEDHRDRTRPG